MRRVDTEPIEAGVLAINAQILARFRFGSGFVVHRHRRAA
jgi:hypothetical protein